MSTTIRRQPIVNNIPAQIDFKLQNITNFGGIIQQDNPLKLSINTASDMKNLYVDEYGALSTRPRTELVYDYGQAVKSSVVIDDTLYILTTSNVLYKQSAIVSSTLILIAPLNASVVITDLKNGFKYNGTVYLNGNDFFLINADSKLEYVYNSSFVHIPYLKRGVEMGKDINNYPDAEYMNILSSKYRISYYWDGETDFNIIDNGTVVQNDNIEYINIPDLRATYEEVLYLPNDYLLQYGPSNAFLLKKQSDLTFDYFEINIPTVTNYITKVTMNQAMTALAVADDNGNRLRIFSYDLATKVSTLITTVFTTGYNINYYSPMKFCDDLEQLAFWSGTTIFSVDFTTPGSPPTSILSGVSPHFAIGSDFVWNGTQLYTLTSYGFRSYELSGTPTLVKEIPYYSSYSIMNKNADGTKLVLSNAFWAYGRIMILNTSDWSVIIDTYNSPILTGIAFDENDNVYMVNGSAIYIMSLIDEEYKPYHTLTPAKTESLPNTGFYLKVKDGLIWNYMHIARYVETYEAGVVVEYEDKEHIEIFTENSPVSTETINFTNNIADFQTYNNAYYLSNVSIGFTVSGSRLSFPIDLSKKGIFSYSILTGSGNYLYVYEVDDDAVRLLDSSDLPAYVSNLRFDYAKPILNFTTSKILFNKLHFAFKNRDYFQNLSQLKLYVPDYNICGDDEDIKDYGVLNSNYSIILKKQKLIITRYVRYRVRAIYKLDGRHRNGLFYFVDY